MVQSGGNAGAAFIDGAWYEDNIFSIDCMINNSHRISGGSGSGGRIAIFSSNFSQLSITLFDTRGGYVANFAAGCLYYQGGTGTLYVAADDLLVVDSRMSRNTGTPIPGEYISNILLTQTSVRLNVRFFVFCSLSFLGWHSLIRLC